MNSRQKGARANRGQKPVDYIEGEIWKPIAGYEGLYEVSNLGRVKSLPRTTTRGGLMKLEQKKTGYVYVGLHKGKTHKSFRVHILVLEAFTDYKSRQGLVVDHIDCNKANNRLDNLEAVTPKVNAQRAAENGLRQVKGEYVIDLDTRIVYDTYSEAAKAIGGNRGEMVSRVCKGTRSHYRNHHFARLSDFMNGTIPMYKGTVEKKASESLWR